MSGYSQNWRRRERDSRSTGGRGSQNNSSYWSNNHYGSYSNFPQYTYSPQFSAQWSWGNGTPYHTFSQRPARHVTFTPTQQPQHGKNGQPYRYPLPNSDSSKQRSKTPSDPPPGSEEARKKSVAQTTDKIKSCLRSFQSEKSGVLHNLLSTEETRPSSETAKGCSMALEVSSQELRLTPSELKVIGMVNSSGVAVEQESGIPVDSIKDDITTVVCVPVKSERDLNSKKCMTDLHQNGSKIGKNKNSSSKEAVKSSAGSSLAAPVSDKSNTYGEQSSSRAQCTSLREASHSKDSASEKQIDSAETLQKLKQRIIQQFLKMGKNNLKDLLNNPSSRKFEFAMKHLMKEHRKVLCRELRGLAQSRIKEQGSQVHSHVPEASSLLDTDVAINLSHLPQEVIEQLGNLLQLNLLDDAAGSEEFQPNMAAVEEESKYNVMQNIETLQVALMSEDNIKKENEQDLKKENEEPRQIDTADFASPNIASETNVEEQGENKPPLESENEEQMTADDREIVHEEGNVINKSRKTSSNWSPYIPLGKGFMNRGDFDSLFCEFPDFMETESAVSDEQEINLKDESETCSERPSSDLLENVSVNNIEDCKADFNKETLQPNLMGEPETPVESKEEGDVKSSELDLPLNPFEDLQVSVIDADDKQVIAVSRECSENAAEDTQIQKCPPENIEDTGHIVSHDDTTKNILDLEETLARVDESVAGMGDNGNNQTKSEGFEFDITVAETENACDPNDVNDMLEGLRSIVEDTKPAENVKSTSDMKENDEIEADTINKEICETDDAPRCMDTSVTATSVEQCSVGFPEHNVDFLTARENPAPTNGEGGMNLNPVISEVSEKVVAAANEPAKLNSALQLKEEITELYRCNIVVKTEVPDTDLQQSNRKGGPVQETRHTTEIAIQTDSSEELDPMNIEKFLHSLERSGRLSPHLTKLVKEHLCNKTIEMEKEQASLSFSAFNAATSQARRRSGNKGRTRIQSASGSQSEVILTHQTVTGTAQVSNNTRNALGDGSGSMNCPSRNCMSTEDILPLPVRREPTAVSKFVFLKMLEIDKDIQKLMELKLSLYKKLQVTLEMDPSSLAGSQAISANSTNVVESGLSNETVCSSVPQTMEAEQSLTGQQMYISANSTNVVESGLSNETVCSSVPQTMEAEQSLTGQQMYISANSTNVVESGLSKETVCSSVPQTMEAEQSLTGQQMHTAAITVNNADAEENSLIGRKSLSPNSSNLVPMVMLPMDYMLSHQSSQSSRQNLKTLDTSVVEAVLNSFDIPEQSVKEKEVANTNVEEITQSPCPNRCSSPVSTSEISITSAATNKKQIANKKKTNPAKKNKKKNMGTKVAMCLESINEDCETEVRDLHRKIPEEKGGSRNTRYNISITNSEKGDEPLSNMSLPENKLSENCDQEVETPRKIRSRRGSENSLDKSRNLRNKRDTEESASEILQEVETPVKIRSRRGSENSLDKSKNQRNKRDTEESASEIPQEVEAPVKIRSRRGSENSLDKSKNLRNKRGTEESASELPQEVEAPVKIRSRRGSENSLDKSKNMRNKRDTEESASEIPVALCEESLQPKTRNRRESRKTEHSAEEIAELEEQENRKNYKKAIKVEQVAAEAEELANKKSRGSKQRAMLAINDTFALEDSTDKNIRKRKVSLNEGEQEDGSGAPATRFRTRKVISDQESSQSETEITKKIRLHGGSEEATIKRSTRTSLSEFGRRNSHSEVIVETTDSKRQTGLKRKAEETLGPSEKCQRVSKSDQMKAHNLRECSVVMRHLTEEQLRSLCLRAAEINDDDEDDEDIDDEDDDDNPVIKQLKKENKKPAKRKQSSKGSIRTSANVDMKENEPELFDFTEEKQEDPLCGIPDACQPPELHSESYISANSTPLQSPPDLMVQTISPSTNVSIQDENSISTLVSDSVSVNSDGEHSFVKKNDISGEYKDDCDRDSLHSCDTGQELRDGTGSRSLKHKSSRRHKKDIERLTFEAHQGPIVDIKTVGRHVLAASEDGFVYCYSLKSGKFKRKYGGHDAAVTCLCVVECGIETDVSTELEAAEQVTPELFFTGSLDKYLRYFSFKTGELVQPPVNIGSAIQCMEQNWGVLFIGTKIGEVIQYNIKAAAIISELPLKFGREAILALKATKEGPRNVLIVGTRNKPITIRDASTGLLLRTINGFWSHTVYSLGLNGNEVFCGTKNGDILVIQFQSGEQICRLRTGSGVVCMRIYNNLLFAGCYDGCIYVFSIHDKKQICSIQGPGKMLLCLDIVKNRIIAGSKNGSKLEAWGFPQEVRSHVKEAKHR